MLPSFSLRLQSSRPIHTAAQAFKEGELGEKLEALKHKDLRRFWKNSSAMFSLTAR
ncbi:MAG: hypothetical protein ACK5NG_06305 [Chthoniobacterales bacterium]